MTTEPNRANISEVVTSRAAYSTGQRCQGGGCPAIYRSDDGVFFVVGRRLQQAEKVGLPMDGFEDAVEVPAELIELLLRRETRDD